MATRQVAVNSTSNAQVLAYDPNRASVIIRNIQATQVWIIDNQGQTMNDGFPLNQYDEIGFNRIDGDQPELPVYAVTAAGTTVLSVVERFGKTQEGSP